MKSFKLGAVALALAGCSGPSSTHLVEVEGAPGEVARFVAAEEARKGGVDVRYRTGSDKAVFSVANPEVQEQVRLRATAAKLASGTRSETVWAVNTES